MYSPIYLKNNLKTRWFNANNIPNILIGIIILFFALIPKSYGALFMPYKVPIVLVVIIVLSILKRKDLHLKSFNLLDFFVLLNILLAILSFFIAKHPYVIWPVVFQYLFIGILYFVLRTLDLELLIPRNNKVIVFSYCSILGVVLYTLSISYFGNYENITFLDNLKTIFGVNANYLATLLLFFIPLILYSINNYKSGVYSCFIFIICLIGILTMFLLNCRGALVSFIFCSGLFLFSLANGKKKTFFIVFSLICFVFIGVVFLFHEHPFLFFKQLNPFVTVLEDTGDERLEIWKYSLALFTDQPWMGLGPNHWFLEFPRVDLGNFGFSFNRLKSYSHAHNIFIENLVERGIVGTLILIFIYTLPIYFYLKLRDRTLLPFLMIAISFLFISLFYGFPYTSYVHYSPTLIIWCISIAILSNRYSKTILNNGKSRSLSIGIGIFICSILCLTYYINLALKENMFNVYQKNKHSMEYIQSLKLLDKIDQDPFFRYIRRVPVAQLKGDLAQRNGKNRLANKYYKEAVSLTPNSLALLLKYSKSKLKLNQDPNSILEKAVEIHSTYFETYFIILQTNIKLGNKIKAEKSSQNINLMLSTLQLKYDNTYQELSALKSADKDGFRYNKRLIRKIKNIKSTVKKYQSRLDRILKD